MGELESVNQVNPEFTHKNYPKKGRGVVTTEGNLLNARDVAV